MRAVTRGHNVSVMDSWAQNERITWCGISRSQDTLTVAGYGLSLWVSLIISLIIPLIIPLIIAHASI
jgi:hypothetical protein